jgi:hypothetical protein
MTEVLTLHDACVAADALAETVRQEGQDSALSVLEDALRAFDESGHPIESLLPHGDAQLGAALARRKSGQAFWAVYADVIRHSLCKKNSELQKLAKAGLSGSAGAIVPALITGLGLPPAALGIAVPLAAIVASLGVDAFCQWTIRSNSSR